MCERLRGSLPVSARLLLPPLSLLHRRIISPPLNTDEDPVSHTLWAWAIWPDRAVGNCADQAFGKCKYRRLALPDTLLIF